MSGAAKRNTRSLWRILRAPTLVGLGTVTGLAAALLGEGWMHVASWLLLAVPLAIIAWAVRR